MRVLVAETMGMCFGVRDAIALAHAVDDPRRVTIHGELVHNPQVLNDLARRGFAMTPEGARGGVPATEVVLITAHGVSDGEHARLAAAGKQVIDTTCPLVRRVHAAARELLAEGRFVVVIGRPGHVEVEGIVGDLEHCAVWARPEDARPLDATRIGVVCQTTTTPADAARVHAAIEAENLGKDIRFVDTICSPTRMHQESVRTLLRRVEALVVVGGRHSNNTRMLGKLAEEQRVPWLHVEGPQDLDRAWLARYATIGLTAGTSTPDETIRAVHEALLRLGDEAGRAARASA